MSENNVRGREQWIAINSKGSDGCQQVIGKGAMEKGIKVSNEEGLMLKGRLITDTTNAILYVCEHARVHMYV